MAKNDPVLRIDQKRDYGVSASSTVFYLNNSNAFFAELSAITADMGTLNAGSIVIGETNKLWLNDDDDGGLAIGGIVKENAPFSISKTGHLTATDVSITAGNGVEINQDGLRIGGAGASALWGGEIKDVNGVGTGVHGLRWYDIAGIPAISILTQKPGTSSPYFRLGRPNDADWMQWDAVGLALSGVITARGGLLGGWTIATDNLYAGSGANRVGMAPGSYPFYAGSETPANANFYVTDAGLVHSIAGDIGGWQIAADGLRSADGAVGMLPGALPFFAGDPFDPAFAVYPNGALIATNATISGIINATAGAINGFLTVGGDPYILIDGETALLKSSNYVAGSTGWQIDSAGDAEFNNLTARGTIKTVVFEKSLITAFAGSQIVAKSASALYEACAVSGTTFVLKVQKQAGAAPFESGDIVRLKDETTDTWATVDAGSDETDYWQYTAAWQHGSTSGTLLSAHAVVDYGQTGQGYYIVSADGLLGASAAWALRSHDGTPWLSETTHVYAGTDGRFYCGEGDVRLGVEGLTISNAHTGAHGIRFEDSEYHEFSANILTGSIPGEFQASYLNIDLQDDTCEPGALNGATTRIHNTVSGYSGPAEIMLDVSGSYDGGGNRHASLRLFSSTSFEGQSYGPGIFLDVQSRPVLHLTGYGTVFNRNYQAAQDFIVYPNINKPYIFGDASENTLRLASEGGKLGFFGTLGGPQATRSSSAATFVANSGTAINDASTFDGYTLKQVVRALRDYGLLEI